MDYHQWQSIIVEMSFSKDDEPEKYQTVSISGEQPLAVFEYSWEGYSIYPSRSPR